MKDVWEDWKLYERLVARLMADQVSTEFCVTPNTSILGAITGIRRQTDLSKFENVFDDHPRWVNLGSQKNFARYALRVGKEWEMSSDGFNEFYFKRAIARGILFRATEKLVSVQPWYCLSISARLSAREALSYSAPWLPVTCQISRSLPWLRLLSMMLCRGILSSVAIGATSCEPILPPYSRRSLSI
ncbi:AIPR family protein [Neorhizobium sp. DT-125]|uniref:AIPR family protein n=1 Tax=Neorhizobium sp. DT-125 TaxID=3396163 RepID=UPI003F1D5D02